MADTNIQNTDTSNLSNALSTWQVDNEWLDSVSDHDKETYYYFSDWSEHLGYYKNVPELKAAIDAKATWTVGKGLKGDKSVLYRTGIIQGIGIDTFNTILENMIRTYHISGDSFAEIIRREDDNDFIINLKPLDPSKIRIVANKQGRLIRYDLISKVGDKKKLKSFSPEKMFHLSRNRIGDEIHGQSMITALSWIIKAKNEAMQDMRTLMHRHVKPIMIHHLDTDDPTAIAAYKAKADYAVENGENMYVPKGNVEIDMAAVAPNATLNPLPWIDSLKNMFFQASGVPDIILGGSSALTEASSKISYLAFQQTIEEEQLYIEETVKFQLGLVIELEFPASLENELISDKQKDVETGATQPNDTQLGEGV
jgi:hypothetical protein